MMKNLFFIAIFSMGPIWHAYAETRCIAHRGDNENYLENSSNALYSAMESGAHGIEFDIRHTADKQAIVFHDKRLKRITVDAPNKTCRKEKKIKRLTLEEIQNNCLLEDGSKILTLEEALEMLATFPGYLFIEFKDRPSEGTLDLIAKYRKGREETTNLISFRRRFLNLARKHSEFYKNIQMRDLNILLPFTSKRYEVNISRWGKSFLSRRRDKQKVSVWTVNKESEIRDLFAKDYSFVTTDRIETCLDIWSEFNL